MDDDEHEATARAANADTRISARNKKTILDAAIGVFTEKGYDGASIAEIAELLEAAQGEHLLLFRLEGGDLPDAHRRSHRRMGQGARPSDGRARAGRGDRRLYPRQARFLPPARRPVADVRQRGGAWRPLPQPRRSRPHAGDHARRRSKVFEAWAAAGKMDRVDPIHLFIMLWASTQYYADFDVLARNALGAEPDHRRRLRARRRDDLRGRFERLWGDGYEASGERLGPPARPPRGPRLVLADRDRLLRASGDGPVGGAHQSSAGTGSSRTLALPSSSLRANSRATVK